MEESLPAPVSPLPPDALYRTCDPQQFHFSTTEELEDLDGIIGQERALEALRFGVGIRRGGYNLFVLGPSGIGKYTVVRQYLEQMAARAETPDDLCYVNNFEQPARPRAMRLPPGVGQRLRADMARLVDDLRASIPLAFETEEYHARVREIEGRFKERRERALADLAREGEQQGIALIRTPAGFAFAPEKDKEVIKPEEYEKLSDEEKQRIEQAVAALQEKLGSIMLKTPQWQREAREEVRRLDQEIGRYAVGNLIDELKTKYQELPRVASHLDAVRADIMEHLDEFRRQEEAPPQPFDFVSAGSGSFRRYEVNVLVDHGGNHGAPVVYEDHPSYQNLVGRVEHLSQMGALVTDFTLIKAGALHRANGGYLILDANKVLMQPLAWEGLKRILKAGRIRIQSPGELYSLVSTLSLEPEQVDMDLKVVLIGDRMLYYLLMAYDDEFDELFKVCADFEEDIGRSSENHMLYARLIATLARRDGLLPVTRHAVARIIEYSARAAGDAEKLSTHLLDIGNLLCEADYWARGHDHEAIEHEDVERAIAARIRRTDRVRDRVYENIRRGIVLIDTAGERVGQVNGLSVMDLGDFSFGQPTRITANTRLGEGEVIDIEREVELGGAIHSKGVLILSSFLAARYAREQPLSLSASLVFEQSYGQIEGDSASVAELCALLSSLADVPLRQWLAVTGSINQHGQVQAIGGVNEKIEGFFDVCRLQGAARFQGVLIPRANSAHLMLRRDVVAAVEAGDFAIYPVSTIDEAITLLTGVEAGTPDAEGCYPEGSVNQRVLARVRKLAEIRMEYSKMAGEHDEHHHA